MARSNGTRVRLGVALAGPAALLAAACAGPGGPELEHDWSGATTLALARVDGLVTVVGVDPRQARARSLAVVPQRSDDTETLSPRLVRLADGRWLVSVPREGHGPDRRYLVNRRERVLDSLPGDERLRLVLPGRTLVAEVASLPDAETAGRAPASTLLVRDPADWSTLRELKVPGSVELAASDPGSDRVCLGGGTRVTVAELTGGRVRPVTVPAGEDIVGLACPGGRPVIVRSDVGRSPGGVRATLARTEDATTVTVAGGRLDGVAAHGSSIVLAVADGDSTQVIEIDTATGGERHRVRIAGMTASHALTWSPAGWLVYTENAVTRVEPAAGRVRGFPLPGTLLDA
ncbi:hypothetical protein ACIRG4_25630 [Streptomyces sp. NPDC102395]|uniref:hypothetical protein n=1 Tax=Streptomyces sp. NPDC102395 TaxID=3366168 RepID=UPI003819A562